ncbi:MAG: DUF5132 domain-containing protein [Methylocapsa sp.]|nr:DUF5132 domain-containing protein [Methylocapsa sp.]
MPDLKDVVGEGAGPVAIGVAAIMLAPTLLPLAGRVLRPLAKGAIKVGLTLYRETYPTLTEAAGDLVAEARAELESPESARAGKTATT